MSKKKTEITKVEEKSIDVGRQEKLGLEIWTKQFNSQPDKDAVKVNKMANNSAYLPISHIENLLDKFFFGLWSTEDFAWQNIANELVGSITLKVRHPLTGELITRTGVGSVQIRVNRETGKKVTNALVADIPHLKSECIKNAAKSIGKIFGRDLSRKSEDVSDFETLLEKKKENKKKDNELFDDSVVGEVVTGEVTSEGQGELFE